MCTAPQGAGHRPNPGGLWGHGPQREALRWSQCRRPRVTRNVGVLFLTGSQGPRSARLSTLHGPPSRATVRGQTCPSDCRALPAAVTNPHPPLSVPIPLPLPRPLSPLPPPPLPPPHSRSSPILTPWLVLQELLEGRRTDKVTVPKPAPMGRRGPGTGKCREPQGQWPDPLAVPAPGPSGMSMHRATRWSAGQAWALRCVHVCIRPPACAGAAGSSEPYTAGGGAGPGPMGTPSIKGPAGQGGL